MYVLRAVARCTLKAWRCVRRGWLLSPAIRGTNNQKPRGSFVEGAQTVGYTQSPDLWVHPRDSPNGEWFTDACHAALDARSSPCLLYIYIHIYYIYTIYTHNVFDPAMFYYCCWTASLLGTVLTSHCHSPIRIFFSATIYVLRFFLTNYFSPRASRS